MLPGLAVTAPRRSPVTPFNIPNLMASTPATTSAVTIAAVGTVNIYVGAVLLSGAGGAAAVLKNGVATAITPGSAVTISVVSGDTLALRVTKTGSGQVSIDFTLRLDNGSGPILDTATVTASLF